MWAEQIASLSARAGGALPAPPRRAPTRGCVIRRRIMELLPATIQEVARALGCRNRAARHHLMKLVDGGAVQFGGRPMRFRPMPGAVYDDQSVTEKARAAMDAALLAAMPGTVCAIAAAADVNHNTARSAMARLAARGQCVVTKQRPLTYARWNDEN